MKKLLFILFLALVATSCKKEKKIERNLWKNGGEWEIKTFEESYETTPSSEYNYSEVINNGGTIQFNKDGTGKMNFSPELADYLMDVLYDEQFNATFTYYNTQNKIYFIYEEVEGLSYNLEWEKNKITMSYTEIQEDYDYDENNNQILVKSTYSIKFICEKK